MEKEGLISIYTKMLEIRRFEEKAMDLFSRALLPGSIHPCVGEEAVAVGVCINLRKDDFVLSTHRPDGHAIAKGIRLDKLMAELFGRKTGCCKGKGGHMHLVDTAIGLVGANGIVGAGIPIAVGVGLSIKLKRTDQVSVCFFGDGASNQGTFHEGLNLAALWKLPVIFVCENNLYAMTEHVSKTTSVKDIASRAVAYGMPGLIVDGMDVIKVWDAAHDAIKRAREGGGPTLIECKTYRYEGHSRGDPPYGLYRTKEEWTEWKKNDPIARFKAGLIQGGALTENEADGIERDVVERIEEAVKFAQESPYPEPEEAVECVYSEGES